MRAREQQFHNAWRASAVSQESAGTTTPSTREKKKELNDVVGLTVKCDTSVQGWINHVRYADTWGLRQHVLNTPLHSL